MAVAQLGAGLRRRSLAIGRAAAQLPFLVIFLAMLAPSCAGNQGWDRHPGPAEVPLGPDNKQLWWVPIDAGSEESLLEPTVYRPSGPGPFPLVTINHGKPRLQAVKLACRTCDAPRATRTSAYLAMVRI